MGYERKIRDDAQALQPELVELRHRLHQHPELGLELPQTQEMVLSALDGLGLEITLGKSLSSVVAVLRGAKRGKSVLLRADMDGLPITEETEVDFASVNDGAMHACGHDLHTAMLVGAAQLLTKHRDQLAGDVVFMFQPGEEGWDGAGHMIAEGVLDAAGTRVTSAYGIHVFSSQLPSGIFATKPGPMMAAADELYVTVRGVGGHASAPHVARDPIMVAAQLVGDLQTLVTRRFDIFDPVVVTVGSFHAGTKANIIPSEAVFEATIRTFSVATRERILRESVHLCEKIAAAYGLEAEAVVIEGYPPTVNNEEHANFVAETVTDVFGAEKFLPMRSPIAGAEDFSRVLAQVPGSYMFLGASTSPDYMNMADNHSAFAQFDDNVLHLGARMHAELAIRALRRK